MTTTPVVYIHKKGGECYFSNFLFKNRYMNHKYFIDNHCKKLNFSILSNNWYLFSDYCLKESETEPCVHVYCPYKHKHTYNCKELESISDIKTPSDWQTFEDIHIKHKTYIEAKGEHMDYVLAVNARFAEVVRYRVASLVLQKHNLHKTICTKSYVWQGKTIPHVEFKNKVDTNEIIPKAFHWKAFRNECHLGVLCPYVYCPYKHPREYEKLLKNSESMSTKEFNEQYLDIIQKRIDN